MNSSIAPNSVVNQHRYQSVERVTIIFVLDEVGWACVTHGHLTAMKAMKAEYHRLRRRLNVETFQLSKRL